jgi:hypothetical protein
MGHRFTERPGDRLIESKLLLALDLHHLRIVNDDFDGSKTKVLEGAQNLQFDLEGHVTFLLFRIAGTIFL